MGILYGISTGPGDPELMTVKAVRLLQRCAVIAAPEQQTALRIAAQAADLGGKEILSLPFPMTEDPERLRENTLRLAERLCNALQGGDVAMLCLGDISLYATFQPVAALVRERGFETELVPGITSFCAAAARTGIPLVSGDQPLQILPFGCKDLQERLRMPGAKVVMKCGRHLPELLRLLEREGLRERSYAVEHCGMPEERVFPAPDPQLRCSYFTIVYIAPEG